MNEYLGDFFPFFEDYYTYPLNIRVGSGTEPFQDKAEFLKFLKNDPKSNVIWMDHHDLQVVCIRLVSISSLLGVTSMEEPAAMDSFVSRSQTKRFQHHPTSCG